MIVCAIDRIDEALVPYSRAISIAAAIWFWGGCALTAGFLHLPDIPFLTDALVFWTGAAFNAVWWGFLRPAVERRRRCRAAAAPEGSAR